MNDINIHVKKVKAVQTKEMIAGIAGSLQGTSDVIGLLIAAVWVLGLVILLLTFSMQMNERRREFAVMRVVGMSRRSLAWLVMQEALLSGACGAVIGTAAALIGMLSFRSAIDAQIGLPFLLPGTAGTAGLAAGAVMAVMLSGAAAAAYTAYRISQIDTARILRGDNG